MDRITSGLEPATTKMKTGVDPVDDELLDLLWDIYERLCLDLKAFKDHPAYEAVQARVCTQRLALALGSLELMHVTGVYSQPCWIADSESVSELYALVTELRHPELGM